MQDSARPFTSTKGLKLMGVQQTPRVLDLLDICWATECKPGDLAPTLYVDVSQNLSRKPWSKALRCFTTSSLIYMFEHDRILFDEEKFRLLGFGELSFENLSRAELKDLSGEAMSVVSVTLVAYALLWSVQYPGLWRT
jgi:hypothetical protein